MTDNDFPEDPHPHDQGSSDPDHSELDTGLDASDLDYSDPDHSDPDASDPDPSDPDPSDPDPSDPDYSDELAAESSGIAEDEQIDDTADGSIDGSATYQGAEQQSEQDAEQQFEQDWAAPPPSSDSPPPPLPPVRRLRRTDASSGPGVAGGIARYLGVETGIIKAAFVVAAFFGGLGIFAYIAGWALIPRESHPDPRPVVLNGSLTGLVIGTLALIGAVSVGFGAGGSAQSLLAPALLIGIGFYLLDQRSSPQVITDSTGRPVARPSWIPPLTTTPMPGVPAGGLGAYSGSPSGSYDSPYSTGQSAPTWGAVHTSSATATAVAPAAPRPPVTAVTMAITAVTVALLIGLDQFAGINISVPQMFGAALAIIVTGIIISLFIGRALGLWFAGFIALIGLAVSPVAVAISVDGVGSTQYTVADQADLASDYVLGTGELIVDLRDVTFTSDAATSVELNAGSIVLYVPNDVTVDLRAHARFGEIIAPVQTEAGVPSGASDTVSGSNTDLNRIYEGREGGPTLIVDVDVRFGSIEVQRG